MLVYVAIFGLLFVAFMGIAVDAGYVLSTHQQLQQAADASSLAAARLVKYETDPGNPSNPFTLSRQAAVDIALANEAANSGVILDPNPSNAPDGDVVIGIWDYDSGTFTPDLLNPNAVQVRAERTEASPNGTLPLFFGSVFFSPTSDVGAMATAVLAPAFDALIIILDPHKAGALLLNGTPDMVVMGKVHVNSDNPCGVRLNGSPFKLQAHVTEVVGGACYPDGSIGGEVVEGADVLEDPLKDLLTGNADDPMGMSWAAYKTAMPKPLGNNGKIDGSLTTYVPGHYPQGLKLESDEFVTLEPGTYLFGGEDGITLHGSSFVTGTDVTLLIDEGSSTDISGSGAGLDICAPDDLGNPLQGVALFSHRNNTGEPEAKITGGGLFKVEGVIYVPGGEVVMGGQPGKEIGAIICNSLTNAGTTGFIITGKGLPPPEGPEFTFLVQ
jgi:Flp pilus assembly protein TadG